MAGPFKILARQIWIKAKNRKPPAAGDLITPKAVQAGSSDAGAQAVNLINRSGLRNRDADSLDEHSADSADMWRSAKGENSGWVEFDLGEVQSLGAIFIWNFNDAWHTDYGVRKVDISVWTHEAGWTKIHDDLAIEQAQGSDDYDEPLYVKLDAIKAQKIRFDDLACFDNADCVGLSEVQFFGSLGPQAVGPYPADGAIGVAVSDLELTWVAGDQAKTHRVYLGGSPDDLKLLGRIEQVGAKMSQLDSNTKFYWRIDEVRADGSITSGKVWSFTTGAFAAWWKLDETEGSAVADSSGSGHHGEIHGNPVWQPQGGYVGGALEFDGVDDYVDTGWADLLPTWTVAAWVKSPAAPANAAPSGPVHRQDNLQINWNHHTDAPRGAAGARVGDSWHRASFGELKGGTWYHLAATYDGENLKAYKDGVLITDNADPSGPPSRNPATLKLGRHAVDRAYFAGTVDDVCVFAYALSPKNIKALHSGTQPVAIASPKAASAPHLLQATLAEPAESAAASTPSPAAPVRPQAQMQPVSAQTPVAEAAPQRSRNWVAVTIIIGIVGAIAGVSFFMKQKTE